MVDPVQTALIGIEHQPITWALLAAMSGLCAYVIKLARTFGNLEEVARQAQTAAEHAAADARQVADDAAAEARRIAEGAAADARRIADDAKQGHSDSTLAVQALSSAFHIFQVNVARDYVSRELLKEFEGRLDSRFDEVRGDIRETRDKIMALSTRPPRVSIRAPRTRAK